MDGDPTSSWRERRRRATLARFSTCRMEQKCQNIVEPVNSCINQQVICKVVCRDTEENEANESMKKMKNNYQVEAQIKALRLETTSLTCYNSCKRQVQDALQKPFAREQPIRWRYKNNLEQENCSRHNHVQTKTQVQIKARNQNQNQNNVRTNPLRERNLPLSECHSNYKKKFDGLESKKQRPKLEDEEEEEDILERVERAWKGGINYNCSVKNIITEEKSQSCPKCPFKLAKMSKRETNSRVFTFQKQQLKPNLNTTLLSSSIVIFLIMLVCGQSIAYQLANNLIANNLPPKFITSQAGQASNSEIVVRVKEGAASIGKLIFTLKGEDPDEDPLTFGVLGSMASDLLRIENVPGNQANVYLRKELDRETTESYQVVITLTDGKLGRGNWITKSMLIIVEDVNDNYPVFGPHRTAISIREDVKVPTVIETIEATDQDEGRFGQVIYKLDELDDGKGSVSSMFSIETIEGKGVISLISPLDYEQKPLYQLRILAIDRAIEHERLTATTSILISVEDCEDRPPMFTFVPSITRIPENLPIGSAVVRVAAIDGDRGINNPIQYKLVSVNGQESGHERDLFTISPESGQISVAHQLNREFSSSSSSSDSNLDSWLAPSSDKGHTKDQLLSQPGSYVIQVRATEISSSGSSRDNSVNTELTVILTDVNDEAPTFNQASYYGEILENSAAENLVTFTTGPPATLVQDSNQQASAKVIDRDQGTNGTFTLHLEGEHSRLFDIWPREATNEANFMIKVSSHVGDSEQQLDFERTKMFSFNIVAREKYSSNGGQIKASSVAQMTVFLKDSNDNYPQFESELYKVEIPENAIRGMHICAVKASDADSGLLGSQGIRYTEIRGEKANKFKLDPLTGVITLKTNDHGFDRETIAQHHLIVEARDSNGSGNRNTTQLLIILTDVNDQRPKFLLDQYEAFIYENELDFQSPLQVQAIDNDAANSPNSRITYSIVAGDPQQNFTIDPHTGRIRVKSSLVIPTKVQVVSGMSHGEADIVLEPENGPTNAQASSVQTSGLDFERIAQKRDDTRQFNLTIKATDSGLPESLSDQTNVIILVYDKNDHAPVFTRNIYSKSIREDAKEGSQVLQVLAQDGDHSPTNSKITYRISSGASDKFVIDSDTGLISVANGANLDIDRVVGGQKRTNYQLNVIAFDGSFGPNQKSNSALVNITIIDVNNKPPEFITLGASRQLSGSQSANLQSNQQLMVVNVNEDAPYGLIVTKVVAFDLDSSAELRYSINYARSEARNEDMVLVEPNLVKDIFTIEPTDGTIKVSKQLDRELFDQVKLRLQVEDIAAQTSDQVAHSYLLIKITDVNDNRPVFKKPVYKAVVNENSISGTSVITLTADDRDLNKTLKYSLDGPPDMMRLVRINPRSGEVTVNDKIDRELYPMINVTVKAEDYGYPHPLTGTSQLLITVRDENDNNPMFLNSSQVQQHQHHYHNHNRASFHHINEMGNQPKNHNMNDSSTTYRLRSLGPHRAVDTTVEPTTALIEGISLQSEELSSRLPLLSPGATAKIREDAPIGYQVAYVRAEDADVGNNGRVTYLIDAASSGGKFRIERDSGIISVAGPLDRESNKQYSLIIEACDNYDLGYSTGESRRAFTQVNIQITDTNDNAPVITTNLQSAAMNSNIESTFPDRLAGVFPTYDDIMNSPGPYEQPLPECLFISEFQELNEPILTVTATDADDPSTVNGQMDLAIVNNLPHNELFGLVNIPASRALQVEKMTTQPPSSTDYTGFGELNLSESSPSRVGSSMSADNLSESAAKQTEAEAEVEAAEVRPKRSLEPETGANFLPDPAAPSSGNFYSPAARSPQSLGSFSMMSGQQTISNMRQRQPNSRTLTQGTFRSASDIPAPRAATEPLMATTEPTAGAGLVMSATMSSVRHHASGLNLDGGEQQVHIVVTQSLKERVGNYSIVVRATDRGTPSLSSIKVINVCVQDVNNHSPVFIRPPLNHTIRVMENATVGTYVSQVEATDSDHGINGELQYSLKQTNIQNNNNDWQSFKIDRLTGVITTAKQFNRQLKKYYTLRVQAQDFGRPTTLSSDIDINIMIVNSGQYQPEFEVQTQTLQFTENVAPGIEWFTLLSTNNLDDDPALINANNPTPGTSSRQPQASSWLTSPCYFIIDSDDSEQLFHLDRYTHRLSNQRPIDREKKANYTLLVQASNNCNKPPVYTRTIEASRLSSSSASSMLDYRSLDGAASSHEPRFRSTRSALDESTTTATHTRDRKSIDQSRTLNNQTSSKLISKPAELVAAQPEDGFNQAAVDALLLGDKSLLKVFIKIKDVNDNAPKFTQKVYTGGITTEADFGTVFMIVQALDADADLNSQLVYSIVKPIKRNLITSPSSQSGSLISANNKSNLGKGITMNQSASSRSKRATSNSQTTTIQAPTTTALVTTTTQVPTSLQKQFDENFMNDIPMNEGDDLFVINPQTGEISLNFDPQKHMKGYFEFEILANDTEGLFDSAKVFIYLLRQDQRVKFVLRLTPQELRQRLNKFRSVFGNITGAIVNIDSYKYYENHDGTVDKKKTSLYLHFVNPDDNTIIDVDKVLTLIDNNIEYLDELYKEFHVLSSEAAHLPLSSSALIDPIDQIRTGLMGIASFLALILVLVIALCLNQRTRYERQLKAATVSAFGSSPLHLDPDFHSQTNLPNTNLHSQDPNPIWMNGYGEQDWLGGGGAGAGLAANVKSKGNSRSDGVVMVGASNGLEDGDYLSSENSDINSLSGVNSVSQLQYNATATATPRDSLNSSHGRVSGSGSGSTSTTNDRQALCRNNNNNNNNNATNSNGVGRQTPQQLQRAEVHQQYSQHQAAGQASISVGRQQKEPEVVGVLKNGKSAKEAPSVLKKRSHQNELAGSHSTFGAFKEVTIYTDHNQQALQSQFSGQQQNQKSANNLIRTVTHNNQQPTSQVNKIASQFNAKHQAQRMNSNNNQTATSNNQLYLSHANQQQVVPNRAIQQRIIVHANGADVNQGIIKTTTATSMANQQLNKGQNKQPVSLNKHQNHSNQNNKQFAAINQQRPSLDGQLGAMNNSSQQQLPNGHAADAFESNLSKLSILNLETTEL